MAKRLSTPKRKFRDIWPFITLEERSGRYIVDTRVGGAGAGGRRHYCHTLAEAETIAIDAAAQRALQGTGSYHSQELADLGISIQEAISNQLRLVRQSEELAEHGLTVQDLVNNQLRLLRTARTPKLLSDALVEFREFKLKEGLRANSLKAVIWEVTRAVKELGPKTSICELSIPTLESYLGSSLTPGTFNTRRKHLVTFLNFALKRGWVEKNHVLNINLRIERYEVHILTPEQVARLLFACDVLQEPARSSMRAYIALAAFAGIRPEELHRLNWRDIDLENNSIYISKNVSKVNDDRNVPITENLRAWLLSIENRTGVIAPASSFRRRFNTVRPVAGFRTWQSPKGDIWHHDVLRHTYGSCWLAIHQNRPLLAEHMGNSARIITKHYKRMVSRGQAEAWFNVLPLAADKIL
jgi:integrase